MATLLKKRLIVGDEKSSFMNSKDANAFWANEKSERANEVIKNQPQCSYHLKRKHHREHCRVYSNGCNIAVNCKTPQQDAQKNEESVFFEQAFGKIQWKILQNTN